MIFLFSFLLANPFTIIINNQSFYEYAPIRYDITARALILNDISCQWTGLFKDGFEDQLILSVYTSQDNEFFFSRGNIVYRIADKTFLINLELDVNCKQITIFKDGYEYQR